MTDEHPQPCPAAVRSVAHYLELLVLLALGLWLLPVYAVATVGAWLIEGRESLTLLQLPIVLAVFWVAAVSLLATVLWRNRARGRTRPDPLIVGHVGGSAIAWALASGFQLRATLVGLVVGGACVVVHAIHDRRTPDLSQDEKEAATRQLARGVVEAMVGNRRRHT